MVIQENTGKDTLGHKKTDLELVTNTSNRPVQTIHSARHTQLLEGQNKVLELIASGVALGEILRHLAAVIDGILEPSVCSIQLLDNKSGTLKLAAAPHLPAALCDILQDLSVEEGNGSGTVAAHRGVEVISVDIADDPHWAKLHGVAIEAGFRACWSKPIISSDERTLGTLDLYSGTPQTLDPNDSVILDAMVALARLALENNQRIEALVTANSRLESLADSVPGVVYQRKFTPEGEIFYTYISEGAYDLFGVPAEEILADPNALFECHGPAYRETFRERIKAASRDLTMWDVEVDIVSRDGQKKFTHAIARPNREEDGSVVWNGIIMEATRLRRARDEAENANRSKSQFLANMSHELRTPLTSIKGSLGLVRSGVTGEMPEKMRSMIDIAYNNSDRLVRLINDILDFEKIEAGKMAFHMVALDLMPLVEQAIEENKGFSDQRGVTLSQNGAVPEARIKGDRDRLKQVLTNLLSNAAKFSPVGAVVEISVLRQDGGYRVAVTDNGPGVPEGFQEKIFGKFAQADSSDARQKGGTGLGLSISKAIVEEHGGIIGFDSEMGKGATFFFDLPKLEETVVTPMVGAAAQDNSGRILVCEDDPNTARLLVRMLEKEHFVVDVADNAAAARELLARNSYDVMTLDLLLSDQDGISFIRELRQEPATQDLPVVVVSAEIQEGVEEINGDAVGIIDWFQKPIDEKRLVNCLDRVVSNDAGRKPRILHVEDDPDLANLVSMLADDLGKITLATTLDGGKRFLREQDFDLIIVDLMLPDGAGEELLAYRSKIDRETVPVIVFSAKELPADAAKNVAAALIKSKTTNEQLVATIRTAIQDGFGNASTSCLS